MRRQWRTGYHLAALAGSLTLAGVLTGPVPAEAEAAVAVCRWNDGIQTAPLSTEATFAGVAVPSATDAWAVGSANDAHANQHALIEHWNGSAWATSPLPRLRESWLTSVRAAAPTSIWAVGTVIDGNQNERALILHWNGRAWTRQPSPNPGRSDQLNGVRVVSATNVWAVGLFLSGNNNHTLILHWNGTAWKQVSSPSPAPSAGLSAVAATSAANAWAVGSVASRALSVRRGTRSGMRPASSAVGKPFILHWNGRAWSSVAAPRPSLGTSDSLAAVGATSAANAWAVGSTFNGQVEQTLILHWNGRSWRRVASPDPGGSSVNNDMTGVTATSASNAWAVGTFGNQSLILRWDGHRWQPVVTLAAGISVSGVAASSAGNAWAVGGDSDGSGTRPLALHCT
jgi:hypothetical protein